MASALGAPSTIGFGSTIELRALEAPRAVNATWYEAWFLVANHGDRPVSLAFAAEGQQDVAVEVLPADATLAPGENRTLEVKVDVPSAVDRPGPHRWTLMAHDDVHGVLLAESELTVALLAVEPVARPPMVEFPIHVRISNSFDLRSAPNASAAGRPATELEIRGSGRVSAEDPGRLRIDLRNHADLSKHKNVVEYRHPDYQFVLSDQRFRLSPLLAGGEGYGLDASGRLSVSPDVDLGLQGLMYYGDQGGQIGVAITTELYSQVELTARTLIPIAGSDSFWGGQVKWAPRSQGIPALDLDGEFGRHVEGEASAFRLRGGVRHGPLSLRTGWEQAEEGYDGAKNDTYTLRIGGDIRASGIDAAIHADYEQRGDYAGDQLFVGTPSYARSRRSLGGSITVGQTRLTLDYERTQARRTTLSTAASATGSRTETVSNDEVQLRVRFPLLQNVAMTHELNWGQEHSDPSDFLTRHLLYDVRTDVDLSLGRLRPRLELRYSLEEHAFDSLRLRFGWSGKPFDELDLGIDLDMQMLGTKRFAVTMKGSYRTEADRTLDFELQSRFQPTGSPDVSLKLGYAVRVPFVLSPRPEPSEAADSLAAASETFGRAQVP